MVASIVVPLAGAILAALLPRSAAAVGLATSLLTGCTVLGVVVRAFGAGHAIVDVGGWAAPLGIRLAIDGLSGLLLAMTAGVGVGVSVYARVHFADRPEVARFFWPLWLFLWAGLDALYQSRDVFNLYVTLELVGLSAVSLVALTGSATALGGAMRYLLVSLVGSIAYLMGVALLYHAYGALDLGWLAEHAATDERLAVPLAVMASGMLLKTGLFPFHVWLPPAHGSAPAPVSALLSALVVKATFYLLVRLWLTLTPDAHDVETLLGLLGAGAVFWGSLQALRQTRLKLLVAYSTVAQLGYLFLAFPLARFDPSLAWRGALYLAVSHALAKAAMFLAAGNVLARAGRDEIVALGRIADRMPLSFAAFALAGISLAGLPPSGGFVGKWLLLESAFAQGAWSWALVPLAGGALTAAYVFRVLGAAFTRVERRDERATTGVEVASATIVTEWTPFALALGAVGLGFAAPWLLPMLDGVLP
jgi:formate hydrogenlyase subunit 3/multisubunit Na+/H+ antiporter MnhD subunit